MTWLQTSLVYFKSSSQGHSDQKFSKSSYRKTTREKATATVHTTQFVDRCTHLRTQYLYTSIVLLRLHNSFEKIRIVSLLEQLKKLFNCYFVSLFHFIRVKHVIFQHNYKTMTISEARWKQFFRIHNWILPNSMLLQTLFLNHNHHHHNPHVHNNNYHPHNNYRIL